MQRSMQRVVAFFSETRQRLRSGHASGQPPTATTASTAYELQEENLGRLHRAAAHGDLAWLRRWRWWLKRVGIDKRDKEKRTPLHLACANGHADVVKYLVQKNCQLNLADSFKRSPLMKAVQCQQEECVAILLEHGADPNLADADGNTALHLAVLSLNTTVAGLLLEHNASIDAQNQDGYTPLNLAVSRHLEEMVEFLQKKGADRRAQDQHESELLVENTEEPPASGAEDKAVLSSSCPTRTADKAALAQDTGGAQPVGGVEQEHDAEFPEDFEACTRLQQELADALKKQAMSEALLEVTTHYNSVLEEDKVCLQKALDMVNAEIRELEEQQLQSEHCVHDLETVLDNKEREVVASSQKLQDFLLASFGTDAKKLEERVQCLETEYARLDATVQQQSSRTEALQRDLQASASHCSQTMAENTTLHQLPRRRKKPATAEPRAEAFLVGDLSQQLQKECKKCMQLEAQNHDLQEELSTMCENYEKLEKSKCQLKEGVAKLKHHLETNMMDHSQIGEYKREIEEQAAQAKRYEMQKVNLVLQVGDLSQQLEKESKKCMQLEAQNHNLRKELSTMSENHEKLEKSKCQLKEEVANLKQHMDTNMVDRSQIEQYKREIEERATQEMREKLEEVNLVLQVGDLFQQLEKESKKCMQLEAQNHNLRKELSTMHENHEKLEKSKCQLKEEVANLKHHMDTNMVDRSQIEQYKRKIEEQVAQEMREKLEEVNLVLRIQAISQDRLEQVRGTVQDMRGELRNLKCKIDNMQNNHLENICQQKSLHAEVERYKELYVEEVKIRKSLANELARANERLAEANAKLFEERWRNTLLSTISDDSEDLSESPVWLSPELGHLGNSLTLNTSYYLGRTA